MCVVDSGKAEYLVDDGVRDDAVEGAMRKELDALGMHDVEAGRVLVVWEVGEINVDISPLLLQ